MKITEWKVKWVDKFIPSEISEGELLFPITLNWVIFRCPCGCGELIWVKIDPEFHKLYYTGTTVTLIGSISGEERACKSHFFIVNNRTIWKPEEMEKYGITYKKLAELCV